MPTVIVRALSRHLGSATNWTAAAIRAAMPLISHLIAAVLLGARRGRRNQD